MAVKILLGLFCLFMIIMTVAVFFESQGELNLIIFVGPAFLIYALSYFRDLFCPFIIDEKGITNKLLLFSDLMAWDEIKYIYVGERHYLGNYSFLMCFSKEPLKKRYFYGGKPNSQNRNHFYIIYREGMLDVLLKYVDESEIQDVERIKNGSAPQEDQLYETSMLRQIRSRNLR